MRGALLKVGSDGRRRRGAMTDGMDVEPVRVQHQSAVIVWMVMRAKSGRTVVSPARRRGRRMEGCRAVEIRRAQGDMVDHLTSTGKTRRVSLTVSGIHGCLRVKDSSALPRAMAW